MAGRKQPTAKQAVGGYAKIQGAKKKGPTAKEAAGGYSKIMKGAKSKTKKAVSRLSKKGV